MEENKDPRRLINGIPAWMYPGEAIPDDLTADEAFDVQDDLAEAQGFPRRAERTSPDRRGPEWWKFWGKR